MRPDGTPDAAERRTIARNAASSYGLRLLLGLSALVLTPYLFRRLGAGGFGTWSVMFTITTTFSLLEFGFSTGVSKFVAELRARGRQRELDDVLGSAVVLMAGLGLVALGVMAAVGLLADGLASSGERDIFLAGMLVLGGALLVRFPFIAYAAALVGFQRYDLVAASESVTAVAFMVGAVVAVEAGAGVLGVAVAYAAALTAGAVAVALLLHRADRSIALRPRRAGGGTARRVLGFGSFAVLAEGMLFVGQRMDTVVIAAIRSAASAAPYAAAIKLQSALQSLTVPFLILIMPMVSDLEARGLTQEVVRRFVLATRVVLQVTLPFAVALALFAEDVVDLWLGKEAPAVTAGIIAVLMAVQIVTLSSTPAEKVLIGLGRVRVVGLLAFIEGVSNLALSIALVASYGAIGAAFGTLLTSAALAPLRLPLACRAVGYPLALLARRSLLPAVASSLPGAVAMLAIWAALPQGGGRVLAGAFAGIGISLAVALRQVGLARIREELRRLRHGKAGLDAEVHSALAADRAR